MLMVEKNGHHRAHVARDPGGVRSQLPDLRDADAQEAKNLALLLRAGALAAPMDIIEERTIGPSLGAENIKKGFHAVLWRLRPDRRCS